MRLLLLAGSLVLNLTLSALFALRPALAPPAFRDLLSHNLEGHTATVTLPESKPAAPAPPSTLWSTLAAGDGLPALIARLRAAGYPASVIRAIVNAQLSALYDARIRAFNEMDPNTPFWKLRAPYYTTGDPRMLEMDRLYRERAKLARDLLADPFFASDADVTAAQRQRFGNLSAQKIEQLQRIEDDYAEMTAAVRAGMGGVTLPEDRDKLALLAREKNADLAAVLTPEELADYELRSSQTASRLRMMLTNFDPSEAEFRAIYQAQVAVNAKFPAGVVGGGAIDQDLRRTAQTEFNQQLRTSLGEARYADYMRTSDREFQQLNRLATQANVPQDTALQAYNLRNQVATESNRIFDDPAMSVDDKRTALQLLAQNTRTQFLSTLGPTVGPTYVKIADQWLGNIERGAAVNFTNSQSFIIMNDGGSISFTGGPSFRRLPQPRPPGK